MKAVIFDMDGVIIDSERISKDLWLEIGDKFGVSREKMEVMFTICLGMNTNDEKIEFSSRFGWTSDIYDKFIAEVQEKKDEKRIHGALPLKAGVLELLDTLSMDGYKIALASSSSSKNIDRNLIGNSIREYFDVVVSGDMVVHAKPHPDIYLITSEKLGLRPEECLVIEDAPNGLTAACRAGIPAVMVRDTVEPTDADINKNVLFVADDLFQVDEFINNFTKSEYLRLNKIG